MEGLQMNAKKKKNMTSVKKEVMIKFINNDEF